MPSRRTKLGALFDDLNTRYFGGKLPKYRVTVRAGLKAECRGAWKIGSMCLDKERQILLDGGMKQDQLIKVLLHEMMHAATTPQGDVHGAPFQYEIRRLHALGAPLTDEDAELAVPLSPKDIEWSITKASFKILAFDILVDDPELTTREVLRVLAYHETGMPVARLLRQYPWVRHAVTEARREHLKEARAERRFKEGDRAT